MAAFRTIIGCNFEQYETNTFEPTKYLVLDTEEEKTVSASAIIAKQPLQNGDTMSDHMYRNPDVFRISGQFSLNGKNWNDDSYDFRGQGDRLTNIQDAFEYIKDNGILCRITTIDEDDASAVMQGGQKGNSKTRFKTRDRMALTSITWTEKQNSVRYSFEFNQVIMVESQEYEPLSPDEMARTGYPYVTSPSGASLGTILANSGKLKETILASLYENGYIDDDWLREVCGTIGEI